VFGAMGAHFAGLLVCGFFVRSMRAARKLMRFSIALCVAASCVFFFPPSLLWATALLAAAFLAGACVAACGFYFKDCFAKSMRYKVIADVLIFSNVLMLLLNMTAIHISPQAGLGCSMLMLCAAFLLALRLPEATRPPLPLACAPAVPSPAQGEIRISVAVPLAFLCLFVVIVTINSGLMYQLISPAFEHLEWLASWYWPVPYIAALFVMRNLSPRADRAYILYVAIAMFGFAFITFHLIGRSWADYLVVDTLLLGACGVFDLFWWSILGGMLELGRNPARILGFGLSANVLGILLGKLIGDAISQTAGQGLNTTLLAMGVVCVTFVLLPPLHKQLAALLKSHIYLTAFTEMPVQEQTRLVREFNLNEHLSEREGEVMTLLIQGRTYKAIGDTLFVSENTIRSHVKNIYAKAGVANRSELLHILLHPPDAPSKM
jgi:DNA-binding CsgD family transcriptional regulator